MDNDISVLISKLKLSGYNAELIDNQTLISKSPEGKRLYRVVNETKYKTTLYDDIKTYNNCRYAVIVKNGEKGLVKLDKMEEVIKPIYKEIDIVDNRVIIIQDENLTGLMNIDMEYTVPMIYKKITGLFKYGKDYIAMMLSKTGVSVWYRIKDNQSIRLYIELSPRLNYCGNRYIIGFNNAYNCECAYDTSNGSILRIDNVNITPDKLTFRICDTYETIHDKLNKNLV
jgi:hypothetical protein